MARKRPSKISTLVNLDFIAHFLKMSGENVSSFSRKAGISKQSMQQWFEYDDMTIAKIKEIFSNYGYDWDYRLVSRRASKEVEMPEHLEIEVAERVYPRLDSSKRLFELRRAIVDAGYTNKDFIERLRKKGLAHSGMPWWTNCVKVDSIFLSDLRNMAEELDCDLKISIKPKPKSDNPED